MNARVQLAPLAPSAPSAPSARTLDAVLRGSRYLGYTYAYPHKTAYRPLTPARALDQVWAPVTGPVFFYVHVPFCQMRCGFCNLFTQARPQADLQDEYVQAVERQARAVRAATGRRPVAQLAFGGGTPTLLTPPQLDRLLSLPERLFDAPIRTTPTSVETSPETASEAHIAQLAAHGVERVSIGIQSFEADELRALGRPVKPEDNGDALDRLRQASIPVLNFDLIYGIEGQTVDSWLRSVRRALTWEPQELFLYPLYIRPLTGLGRRANHWVDHRPTMYHQARALLIDAGYAQTSMRMFTKSTAEAPRPGPTAPAYRCQSDAMIGLGCGARSYTQDLHYSSEWAVGARGVKAIVADWVRRAAHDVADYGFVLDAHEQRTRHLLQSLLCRQGLDRSWYRERFGSDVLEDFPQLRQLEAQGLSEISALQVDLTDEGFGWSDAIGPWLYSDAVMKRMGAFELR